MPICTLCAVGVAAGVGLSRWLKIDDLISGLWIGAFLLFLSLLSVDLIFRKKEKKPRLGYVISIVLWWALSFVPLYLIDFFGDNYPKILGIEKLVFSSFMGLLIMLISISIDKFIRKNNDGKVKFPYQRVIIPLGILIIFSLLLSLI